MNLKHLQSIYHANVNVELMEKNVTQINGGITVMFQNDSFWNTATCSCTIFSNYV